ncbi:MAG: SulP family inorganic anion transporter [Gemmatimonadetes bacterium]|nr:SulP family inorganic anion transporter [Gemmatimonadota bacterium]MCY3676690.1 SulP family inorganic anion transporter [Gemmatimonadota bacterium]MYA41531.1 SulP family inorganic anion transporter [Gemmatimonadota bacterium]MYE95566.1 SulP family inorganic anion transporter [Gemmatimonadota bacterium]MYJ11881.1 SulP family inorganic anion transporter [Gemmatimonadota bacterium]
MRLNGKAYTPDIFRGDLFGGLTSAVVALPVALAFGVASGLGAAAGLYSVIAVGFFASVFGGTRSQISGPTGPMTVAMAVVITTHASTLGEAFTIVILGGALQILLGLLRMGRFVVYTPYVVISGFMSGVGLIIMLIQALPFLGAAPAAGGPLGALRALPEALADLNPGALALAAISLITAVLWPRRLAKYLPGLLVALLTGTALSILWLGNVPVIGEIPSGLPRMQLELPTAGFLIGAFQPALILALLGSVDSLLTSLVADSLTGTRHNPNRELVGQGIGNMVSGVFGGLPGAGATMGTVTNIRAGGTTQVSGALRALLVLALVLGLGQYVEPIPHAVLAGILMKVGWDIIDWPLLTRIHRIRREHLLVMLLTLGLTVFVDLVTAVAIGLIAAGMVHARQIEGLELESVVSVPVLDHVLFAGLAGAEDLDIYAARVGLVRLNGNFTVASSQKLYSVVGEDIKDHEVVVFDFTGAKHIDDSAAMTISRIITTARAQDTECIAMGLSGSVARTLGTLDTLREIPESHVVETMDEARDIAFWLLTESAH